MPAAKKKDEPEIVECVTDAPRQGPLGETARADILSEGDLIAAHEHVLAEPEKPAKKK